MVGRGLGNDIQALHPSQANTVIKDEDPENSRSAESREEKTMTDLSTQAAQAQHYAPIRARLMNGPPKARSLPPAPPPEPVKVIQPFSSWPPVPLPMVEADRDWVFVASGNTESTIQAIHRIMYEVCKKHNCTVYEAKSPQRYREIVACRQEICYRLKTETPISLPHIGRIMGGRDHTTILHSVRKHKQRLADAGVVLEAAE